MDELEQAAHVGQSFREGLKDLGGYQLTKWFDGVSRYVKPAVLAIAVASGATGCSSMAQQSAAQHSVVHDSLVVEAQNLNTMDRAELLTTILARVHLDTLDGLERVNVDQLAESIAAAPNARPPLDTAKALENPFNPNRPIHISMTSDREANLRIIEATVLNDDALEYLESKTNGFSISGKPVMPGSNSIDQPAPQAFVVLMENIPGTHWAHGDVRAKPESIAFTLYHELAHPHMTQDLIRSGERADPSESPHIAYKILTEAHADVTAILAVNKSFDLAPDVLQKRIDRSIKVQDQNVLDAGLKGAPKDNLGYGAYRGSRAFEVVAEIAQKDPEFLKSLSYEAMPLVAQDIVKSSGYFHNAAELILAGQLQSVEMELSVQNKVKDQELLRIIRTTLPDRPELTQAASDINTVWGELERVKEFHTLKAALESRPGSEEAEPAQTHQELTAIADSLFTAPSTSEFIKVRLTASPGKVSAEQFEANMSANMAILKQDVVAMLDQLPSKESLELKRADALKVIQGELTQMHGQAMADDHNSALARGDGQSTSQVVAHIMNTYSASFAKADIVTAEADLEQDRNSAPGM